VEHFNQERQKILKLIKLVAITLLMTTIQFAGRFKEVRSSEVKESFTSDSFLVPSPQNSSVESTFKLEELKRQNQSNYSQPGQTFSLDQLQSQSLKFFDPTTTTLSKALEQTSKSENNTLSQDFSLPEAKIPTLESEILTKLLGNKKFKNFQTFSPLESNTKFNGNLNFSAPIFSQGENLIAQSQLKSVFNEFPSTKTNEPASLFFLENISFSSFTKSGWEGVSFSPFTKGSSQLSPLALFFENGTIPLVFNEQKTEPNPFFLALETGNLFETSFEQNFNEIFFNPDFSKYSFNLSSGGDSLFGEILKPKENPILLSQSVNTGILVFPFFLTPNNSTNSNLDSSLVRINSDLNQENNLSFNGQFLAPNLHFNNQLFNQQLFNNKIFNNTSNYFLLSQLNSSPSQLVSVEPGTQGEINREENNNNDSGSLEERERTISLQPSFETGNLSSLFNSNFSPNFNSNFNSYFTEFNPSTQWNFISLAPNETENTQQNTVPSITPELVETNPNFSYLISQLQRDKLLISSDILLPETNTEDLVSQMGVILPLTFAQPQLLFPAIDSTILDRILQVSPSLLPLDTQELIAQISQFPREPELRPQVELEILQQLVENAISGTAQKYPWLINSSDSLSFSPLLFDPIKSEAYFDLDYRWAEQNPVLNQTTFGVFPADDQLYWVLDGNRIVMETNGYQGGIIYQGMQQDITLTRTMTLTQGFSGYQAVWTIPDDFQRLIKEQNLDDFTIISLGGSVTNPEGTPAGNVVLDTSQIDILNNDNQEVIVIPNTSATALDLGSGSTYSPKGGGALFSNAEVENSPMILQGFPTTNLQPLAGLNLKAGTFIPNDILAEAGISWGNVWTGEPARFTAPSSSGPGMKIAQQGKFDNEDLLNILVNPFLRDYERDFHYLNSLLWVGMGRRPPEFRTFVSSEKYYDWYRFYVSMTNNRIKLTYDPEEILATYTNVYSSPGFSLTFAYNSPNDSIDSTQSLNSTLGMLMGGIFRAINPENINEDLDEARKLKEAQQIFAPIQTKSTTEQRRQMNQRINSTLAYGSINSSLNQVSGVYTFPGDTTPSDSGFFQLRTGNIKRPVQYFTSEVGEWKEGDTFISEARLSNRTFGPLTYLGTPLSGIVPDSLGEEDANQSSAAKIILMSPEGQQYIKEFNSNDLTVVPVGINIFDLAFDRFAIQRIDRQPIYNNYFNGYLYLPALEANYAGSSGNFNYAFNTGLWFNLDPSSAPGIKGENLGRSEPSVGIYTNLTLNYTASQFFVNDNNQIGAILTHIPTFKFNWNSDANPSNPWQMSLSYNTFLQTRPFNLSLTNGVAYIPDYSNGEFIGLQYGRLNFPFGLELNFNTEYGKTIYYNVNVLQRIIPEISLGGYVSNYTEINKGFNSRIEGLNYGGIVQYNVPDSPVNLTAKIGTGDNGFEATVKGGFRF
jgi:hypothetical protein